jgi:hypothetical protein
MSRYLSSERGRGCGYLRAGAVLVGLSLAIAQAHAGPITLNAYRSSFIQLQQNNNSQMHSPNTGMRVGYDYTQVPYQDYQYRGYAVFDLSGIQAPIAAANLQGTMLSSDLPIDATFKLCEVQTSADQVLTLPTGYPPFVMGSNRWIFNDLGDGLVYGTGTARQSDHNQPYSVPLSHYAIDDINGARGQKFTIGAAPTFVMNQWDKSRKQFHWNYPKLVLYPFGDPVDGGGGVDFFLDEAEQDTDGRIDITDRGCKHHMSVQAVSQQTQQQRHSEVRQRFLFQADDDTTDPRTIFLQGLLEGDLDAGGATASVNATIALYDDAGNKLDDVIFFDEVSSQLIGDPQSKDVAKPLVLEAELTPGKVYQLVSRLDLSASLNHPDGSGLADFSNTFDVQMSGVPEPATIVLLVGGLAGVLRRHR